MAEVFEKGMIFFFFWDDDGAISFCFSLLVGERDVLFFWEGKTVIKNILQKQYYN